MTISNAVKDGRLRACVVRDPETGRFAGLTSIEEADREWLANSDYTDAPQRAPAGLPAAVDSDGTDAVTLGEASAWDKHWKAKLSELKYNEAVGKLIQASDVRREWTETLAQCRTKLLALPSQIRQAIPSLTLDDVVIVENLVRGALEDLVETHGTEDV
jgi:hypothetical protein